MPRSPSCFISGLLWRKSGQGYITTLHFVFQLICFSIIKNHVNNNNIITNHMLQALT